MKEQSPMKENQSTGKPDTQDDVRQLSDEAFARRMAQLLPGLPGTLLLANETKATDAGSLPADAKPTES